MTLVGGRDFDRDGAVSLAPTSPTIIGRPTALPLSCPSAPTSSASFQVSTRRSSPPSCRVCTVRLKKEKKNRQTAVGDSRASPPLGSDPPDHRRDTDQPRPSPAPRLQLQAAVPLASQLIAGGASGVPAGGDGSGQISSRGTVRFGGTTDRSPQKIDCRPVAVFAAKPCRACRVVDRSAKEGKTRRPAGGKSSGCPSEAAFLWFVLPTTGYTFPVKL
jgi:hypothetical protein